MGFPITTVGSPVSARPFTARSSAAGWAPVHKGFAPMSVLRAPFAPLGAGGGWAISGRQAPSALYMAMFAADPQRSQHVDLAIARCGAYLHAAGSVTGRARGQAYDDAAHALTSLGEYAVARGGDDAARVADLIGRAMAQMRNHHYTMSLPDLAPLYDALIAGQSAAIGAGRMFAAGSGSIVVIDRTGGGSGVGGGGGGSVSKSIKGNVRECLREAGLLDVLDRGVIGSLEDLAREGLTVGEVLTLIDRATPSLMAMPENIPFTVQILTGIISGSYDEDAITELNGIISTWNASRSGYPVILDDEGWMTSGVTVKSVAMSPDDVQEVARLFFPQGVDQSTVTELMTDMAGSNADLTRETAIEQLEDIAQVLSGKYERAREIILNKYFNHQLSVEEHNRVMLLSGNDHFQILYTTDGNYRVFDRWYTWADHVIKKPERYPASWLGPAREYVALSESERARLTNPPNFALMMDSARVEVKDLTNRDIGTMVHSANWRHDYARDDIDPGFVSNIKEYRVAQVGAEQREMISLVPIERNPIAAELGLDVLIVDTGPADHYFVRDDRVIIIATGSAGAN